MQYGDSNYDECNDVYNKRADDLLSRYSGNESTRAYLERVRKKKGSIGVIMACHSGALAFPNVNLYRTLNTINVYAPVANQYYTLQDDQSSNYVSDVFWISYSLDSATSSTQAWFGLAFSEVNCVTPSGYAFYWWSDNVSHAVYHNGVMLASWYGSISAWVPQFKLTPQLGLQYRRDFGQWYTITGWNSISNRNRTKKHAFLAYNSSFTQSGDMYVSKLENLE